MVCQRIGGQAHRRTIDGRLCAAAFVQDFVRLSLSLLLSFLELDGSASPLASKGLLMDKYTVRCFWD